MAEQYSAAAFYNAYPNGGTTGTSQPTLSSTFDASSAATVVSSAPLSYPALANANPPSPSMDVASQSIQDLGWIADVSREELIAFFAPSDEQPEMEMAMDAPTIQNDNGQGQAGASQAPYHALPNPIASHAGPSVPPVYTDNNGSYGGPYATAHEHLSPGTGGRVPPTYPDQLQAFSFRYPPPGNYVYGLVDQHQHQHQGGANGPSPYPAAVASSTYNAPQYSYGYQHQYPNAGYSQQQGSVVIGPNVSTGFLNQNPYQGAGPSSYQVAPAHTQNAGYYQQQGSVVPAPASQNPQASATARPLPPLNHPAFAPAPVAFAENRVQYANFLNMVRAATMQTERIRWEIAAQNVALRNMVNGSANFQAQTPTPQLPPNSGSRVAPVNAHAGPSRLPASAQTAAGSSSFSDQSQLTWRPPNEDLNASNPKKRKRKENIPCVDDPEIRTCLKNSVPQHMEVSFACFRPSDNPAHARPDMNGTVAGVRKHDADFHGFPTNYAITQNNRRENKDNRHIYPEVECGWKDPDSNAVCEMRLRQDKMAQHICTVHLRSNWYRCQNADHCKTVCRTLEELAPHMLGCRATSTAVWLKTVPAAKKQKTGNEESTD